MGSLLEETCIAAKVRRVHRAVVAGYDHALRSLGITIGQLDMLVTILDLGEDVSSAELGRALLMERSTVSRNLNRLASRGLVRLGNPSARMTAVRLTPKGRRLVEDAYQPWSQAQARISKKIGTQGVRALDVLVDKL